MRMRRRIRPPPPPPPPPGVPPPPPGAGSGCELTEATAPSVVAVETAQRGAGASQRPLRPAPTAAAFRDSSEGWSPGNPEEFSARRLELDRAPPVEITEGPAPMTVLPGERRLALVGIRPVPAPVVNIQ